MRILGDSNIVDATITATNIATAELTDKLKTFQLVDNMRTLTNSTQIDLVFNAIQPNVNGISLCGTNLTDTSVITLSWSDTDINSPDDSIILYDFSTLNQVFFLDNILQKKFWRITITDSAISTIFIGYLYIGVYLQFDTVIFPTINGINLKSVSKVTDTGQSYGSKIYNNYYTNLSIRRIKYELLEDLINLLLIKQNIDSILFVAYEDNYTLQLFRPKFGILTNVQQPFIMDRDAFIFGIDLSFKESF